MFFPEGVTHQPGSLWFVQLHNPGLCTGHRAFGGAALCTEHLLCRRHLQQSICTRVALAVSPAALSLACSCWPIFTVTSLSRALCAPLAGRSSGRQSCCRGFQSWLAPAVTVTGCSWPSPTQLTLQWAQTHSNPATLASYSALSDKHSKHLSLIIFALKNYRHPITFTSMRDLWIQATLTEHSSKQFN